jgi:hypothetical protein
VSTKRVERLEKTLARVAREQGLDQERLRRCQKAISEIELWSRGFNGLLDSHVLLLME